jgi:hypothetical protein
MMLRIGVGTFLSGLIQLSGMLQAEGIGRGILKEIAAREAKRLDRHVARETARDWVRGARERGFLTPGKPGRAGAQPGPNLYRIPSKEE